MFGSRFNPTKCETNARLCLGRIKLLRNKKNVQLKQMQKSIAELLQQGKQEAASIRVEGVIREKLMLQAYEILELYLELMTMRAQQIAKTKELPRDLMEAVSSIVYASQRISDLPELSTLRALFDDKYGRNYVTEAGADATVQRWQVNRNLIQFLLVEPPKPEDKLDALSEIAQLHNVEWDQAAATKALGVGGPVEQLPFGSGNDVLPVAAVPKYPIIVSKPAPALAPVGTSAAAVTSPYTSVHHAAAAAAQAAAQASAAAQYVAHVAMMQPGAAHGAAVGNGHASSQQAWQEHPTQVPVGGSQYGMGGAQYGMPVGGAQYGMPTMQPHPDAAVGPSAPSPWPMSPAAPQRDAPPSRLQPSSSDGSDGSSGGGTSALPAVGVYRERSMSDIQRAYDAAQGPPTKGDLHHVAASPLPPLLPPPPPPSEEPTSAMALPSPPIGTKSSVSPPPQDDDFEELTRRLDALKRS